MAIFTELSKSSVSEVYVSIETSDGYFLTINTEAQGPRRVYLEDTAFPTHQTCKYDIIIMVWFDNLCIY